MVKISIIPDTYSAKIGLQKTVKNISITYGLPALLFFLNAYQEWLPVEYAIILAPVLGAISYFLKNYIENIN